MPNILHITTQAQWEASREGAHYRGDTLESDGFIHCSLPGQVLFPANSRFRGRTDLVLLVIDERRIRADVRYEDCYATGMDFPHIYGPLNLEAIVNVADFPPREDGTFHLPDELRTSTVKH